MTEYNQTRYYRQKASGYDVSRDGDFLHRDLYRAEFGNIPHGWHVHHKDGDPTNSVIENLEALPAVEHAKHHRGPKQTFVCMGCGVEYQKYANPNGNKYCSNACICRAYKQRRRQG